MTGPLNVETATYPPVKGTRTTSQTNTVYGAVAARHETTADMVDGFGVGYNFEIVDSAGVCNIIANIVAVRDGADNSGLVQINTLSAGSWKLPIILKKDGGARIGEGVSGATNYTDFAANGSVSFAGTSRIEWTKITAASVTTANGTETGTVTNLQSLDASIYKVGETAGTPFTCIVDFTSVVAFNWVNIVASYGGSATHGVAIQLWNWTGTPAWNTFNNVPHQMLDVATAGIYILGNRDFFVPDDTPYIGTGGDAGKVRVRFAHSPAGVNGHDLMIDVVALYR